MNQKTTPENLTIANKPFEELPELKQIKAGLSKKAKQIAPKFFYDSKGSDLFNKICETNAYYQTRTELGILQEKSHVIAELFGVKNVILEPGAGNMRKVRTLFEAAEPEGYIGIDISKKEVINASYALARDFPRTHIFGIVGDFLHLDNHELRESIPDHDSRSVFFPGSTIGNFEPDQAQAFLKQIGNFVGDGGVAVFGVDLKKSGKVLNLAYNDPEGLTRDFNLNVLTRLNREHGFNFDPSNFNHLAIYKENKERVEMHLVSSKRQLVLLGNEVFKFEKGETIHTENSYKYTKKSFECLVKASGFNIKAFFTDTREYFGVAVISFQPDNI